MIIPRAMNRLADETSPYLLQHAGNPVHWHPWGEEAFARAREDDRPLFVSIGYSACHWCHVMERESFEDPQTAQVLNEHFVSVKVDREERPDVDAVYMDAVVALTGQGGWPMSVFLTPGGEPFFGGTYFPPEPRHGLPSFRQVLVAVAEAWESRRGEVAESAANLAAHLRAGTRLAPAARPARARGARARAREPPRRLRRHVGRVRRPPEVPAGQRARVPAAGRGEEEMTRRTLDGMALGGMHDLVGGGFHRYSVDERWLVPHFEKMLYDNALLASVYTRAARRFGDERYRAIAERTLDYVQRELALDGGGFASAQDADTDGVEGLTFTWAPGEGAPDELLQPFEGGRFVLRGDLDDATRTRLLELRSARPQPARDDKAIASWNGLLLAALAQAGRVEPATALAEFLLGPLSTPGGRLQRTWRRGIAKGTGYLEDYADVAHGLTELHVASGDPRWLREAHRLATLAVELFADDEEGGFYQAPLDGEQLVARKKELADQPTPSGNTKLAFVLLRLGRIWGDQALEQHAVSVLRLAGAGLARTPTAFGFGLVALHQHLAPHRELAIVGARDAPVARAAVERAAPTDVIAFGPAGDIPLLEGRGDVSGEAAVYVCERFACRAPVTDPAALG